MPGQANTEYIVKKANKGLWMIRRLKALGANIENLIEIYRPQVRSVSVCQGNIRLKRVSSILCKGWGIIHLKMP